MDDWNLSQIPPGRLSGIPHHEYGNRCEIGVFIRRMCDEDDFESGRYFRYEESLAVAALIMQGWPPESAASVVDHGLVYAVPFVPGFDPCIPPWRDGVRNYQMGVVGLRDGTVWWIIADLNYLIVEKGTILGNSKYRLDATNGLLVIDEDITTNVRRCFPIAHSYHPHGESGIVKHW